ncbi:hypothetical protein AAHH80_37230, partial [Burkholderia pseudomallei]
VTPNTILDGNNIFINYTCDKQMTKQIHVSDQAVNLRITNTPNTTNKKRNTLPNSTMTNVINNR